MLNPQLFNLIRTMHVFTRTLLFFLTIVLMTSCNRWYTSVYNRRKMYSGRNTINSHNYYNPFTGALDSSVVLTRNGLETPNLLNVMNLNKGRGKYMCFLSDTIKILDCDIYKGKIHGGCVVYTSGVDSALYGEFRKNKLHGLHKQYSASGKLLYQLKYKRGKAVKGSRIVL